MIEALELCKEFDGAKALSSLSFHIPDREIAGLLGPNGAGKTTTIRILTTSLTPTSGTARVGGFDVLKEADQVRKRIGYLPEVPPLYPEMRVQEYLHFVAELKGVQGTRAAVDRVLESCNLGDVRRKLCGVLSKGYRQRLGIAQAIIHQPTVVILDEPTSGLDPEQIQDIRGLIKSLAGERTVVLSTHLLQEVTQTCSHVIVVAKGRVVVEGRLEDVTRERSLESCYLAAVQG